MRTSAWERDESWATSPTAYSDRHKAVQEAQAWACHEGYRFCPLSIIMPSYCR